MRMKRYLRQAENFHEQKDYDQEMGSLEKALETEKNVKYLYTIPNFQNPSGITMSFEKRKKVYELSSTALFRL